MERPEEVSREASFFIGEESKAQETHRWPLVEPCCAGTRTWLPALPLSWHMAKMLPWLSWKASFNLWNSQVEETAKPGDDYSEKL